MKFWGFFQPISKAFDCFLPILKDAAIMARESVRACAVFSQWSRDFGVRDLSDGEFFFNVTKMSFIFNK